MDEKDRRETRTMPSLPFSILEQNIQKAKGTFLTTEAVVLVYIKIASFHTLDVDCRPNQRI